VIVKHNNPCGAARAHSLEAAYTRAYMADRVAAFGGCIGLNRAVDKATAQAIASQYAEVVVAPEFEDGVLEILGARKNLRVIRIQAMDRLQRFVGERVVDFKSLMDGGVVVQWSFVPKALTREDLIPAVTDYQGQTFSVNRPPTNREYEDMLFGWLVESGITSNSVIYVKDNVTVGIGTGEQDRVGVARIAVDKAYRKLADRYCFEQYHQSCADLKDEDKKQEINARVAEAKGGLIGAAMISDAFFPFRDGIDVGLSQGIKAVIQPGGSLNDYQSIQACNEYDAAMVFTGQRSFKH
jgi:phosphoribosylaminoimidazolecarboxamide formyltransferase/IMP cyclohydrolase